MNIFFQSGNRSINFRPNFRLNFVNWSLTINLFKNIVFLGNTFELSQASKRWAVQKALNLWAGVANLHFREVRQWQGNINIGSVQLILCFLHNGNVNPSQILLGGI